MTIKSDLTNRYVVTDEFEDVKLHVDIRDETVEFYLGHTHPAVNERLEALEASIMFDGDTLDDLIGLLIYTRSVIRKAE